MAVVSVCNLKGGVGKSTIAVNLACALRYPGHSVVLVDADSQGTATRWAAGGRLPIDVRSLPLENVMHAARWINDVLAIDTDIVVIDCPPHVGAVTQAAVGIADLVLVPVGASGADLAATIPALELVRQARMRRGGIGPRVLLVPSRIDRRTRPGREIESALKKLGSQVGPTIYQRTAHIDAFTAGMDVGTFVPRKRAHKDIVALAREVAQILWSTKNDRKETYRLRRA